MSGGARRPDGEAPVLAGVRAVILDLDGVVTDTATLHRRAWKRMFDAFLQERRGEAAEPFTEEDYRRYVDGRPRYEGAAAFLASRGIDLPRGDPDDPPDRETICGLGNRKNRYYRELLDREGVEPMEGAADWLREARERGYRLGIVTSSRNGRRVLEAARLAGLFEARVDGRDGEERGLAGKPDPAYFLAAARDLGVEPGEAAVVEDAEAGVAAGRDGGFRAVIGVAGADGAVRLREAGAHVVVERLAKLPLSHPNEREPHE